MLKDKKISVVIPCKNEEKGIARAIKSVPSYVDEIIVVDNGSTDNTAEVAKEAGAVVIKESRKVDGIGYGFAHITGLKYASGDFIVALDGDDTYPADSIKDIVAKMEKDNLDVVSCNRLPLKNKKAISKIRQFGIMILNIEVFLLYGRVIKDVLTGMWCVRKSAVSKLGLRMGDWNLSPEIKISAIVNKNIKFAEYHINHFERLHEPSKQAIWNTGLNHFLYILNRRFTQDSFSFSELNTRKAFQKLF